MESNKNSGYVNGSNIHCDVPVPSSNAVHINHQNSDVAGPTPSAVEIKINTPQKMHNRHPPAFHILDQNKAITNLAVSDRISFMLAYKSFTAAMKEEKQVWASTWPMGTEKNEETFKANFFKILLQMKDFNGGCFSMIQFPRGTTPQDIEETYERLGECTIHGLGIPKLPKGISIFDSCIFFREVVNILVDRSHNIENLKVPGDVIYFLDLMKKIGLRFQNIKFVELSEVMLTTNLSQLIVDTFKSARHIKLTRTVITSGGLAVILERAPTLELLDFSSCGRRGLSPNLMQIGKGHPTLKYVDDGSTCERCAESIDSFWYGDICSHTSSSMSCNVLEPRGYYD